MPQIIDYKHREFERLVRKGRRNKQNGAYFYSKEISDNIIPLVKTDRNWITINIEGFCYNHSIVFIHNNKYPYIYDWLKGYNDLVLVCGIPSTCEKVKHLGKTIYLPLSVDVGYVEKFRVKEKVKELAYVGRREKRKDAEFSEGIPDYIENLPRESLLAKMSEYKKVYAVGRAAIEAKILDCKVLPYDPRFPDPDIWQVVDNKDAAKMLQELLDEIDGEKR